jgi:hypothetical protein
MSVDDTRLGRLEATEQIRQLASRYALALDSRNVPDLVALFVDDVRTGDGGVGREALAAWFDPVLRPYGITFHLIGNHVIDFVDDDHATGVVYCRPEHEVGGQWIVMPMQYWDRYERRDGRWYFKSRSVHPFYAAHLTENPTALEGRYNFPGNPLVTRADLPERWASWQSFWTGQDLGL